MTPSLQLALALVVVVSAAKAAGYLSYRLGQPSVLGELIAGIILGPTVVNLLELGYFNDEHLTETIHQFAELGVLLLMFLAGLELQFSDLAKSGKAAMLAGTLGVIVPMALGAGAGYVYSGSLTEAIFIGLILAATSVSISAQTLMELKVIRSRVGITLLGSAVFDDILVVLLLSVFSALMISGESAGITSILWVVLRMILFMVGASVLGFWLLPRLSNRISHLTISQGLAAFAFVVILFYGWAAEELGGMAAITGAFLAGLILARSQVKDRLESAVSVIAFGLFVPIFFVNIGLAADARELIGANFWFFIVIILIAVAGKILGAGLGGLWGGLSKQQAFQLGIGMVSRGEVGLIVASVGITNGFIRPEIFSVIVGVVVFTTLITPPLLRSTFQTRSPRPRTPSGGEPPPVAPEGEY